MRDLGGCWAVFWNRRTLNSSFFYFDNGGSHFSGDLDGLCVKFLATMVLKTISLQLYNWHFLTLEATLS